MKKTIIILLSILIGIYLVLSYLVPNREYRAEQLLYSAGKKFSKIKLNPDASPLVIIKGLEQQLKAISTKYAGTKAAVASETTLVELYLSQKQYTEAIELLSALISAHPDNVTLATRAHFLKGVTYESMGNWDKALVEFRILANKYPETPAGVQAPLHIATYYAKKGMGLKAEGAYAHAVSFYKKLKLKNKGNMLGYTSSTLLMQAYIGSKRFQEAGEALKETLIDYPAPVLLSQQLSYVELIFVKLLNKPDKAIELYGYIRERIDNENLDTLLGREIERLEKTEETVSP